uniref:Protein kinase domain-containing protein n=1 Tax=Oryzias latipes TaxID=8090 RepID=A0A3P9J7X8_ORYLA
NTNQAALNDLKNLKEKMSRKGNKQTEAVELRVGSELVGSKGVYIVKEFLGEGGFGKVAKCSKLWSLEYYAVKIMKISREGQKEFETMKLIQDLDPDENHLIKMYECFTYRKMTCIVYELLEVNFHDSLMNEQQLVPLCYIRVIAQQLLKALKALKSIGVAHCDIKLDNIMFKDLDDMNVKLIDFGLAVETNEILTGTKMQVTQFRAPEVILGLPLDESVDMWALGMALACVYCGYYLFLSSTEYETIRAMVHIFGLPEADVLHRANYKDAFFTRDNGDWRLCTPEEYTEITGNRVRYMNPVIDFDAMTDKHRNISDSCEKPAFQENLEKPEDLQTDKDKAKISRKGNKKTEALELMVGHYLVGNQGIYKVQEFLGEGGFGKVARCTKLGSPEMYAIKIITNVQEGKEEFESMKLIQVLHPDENHLMKMYECFSFQNVICLVYEILEESLEDFLIKNECKATPLTYVRALAQQMFQALKALKSIGVVHCDIKLDNIMFADKKSLKFKLIDFGLAVESKELPIGTEIQVTRFRAPEVILGLPLDESVDMWALGMVLACVYFGNYPFPSRTEYETIRAMVLCTPEEYTKATGKELRKKNHCILEVNPQRRITPSQALEHDFITMKHLAGKSKAAYAAGCEGVMGKTASLMPVPSPDKCRGLCERETQLNILITSRDELISIYCTDQKFGHTSFKEFSLFS